jgi:hypothetical protein
LGTNNYVNISTHMYTYTPTCTCAHTHSTHTYACVHTHTQTPHTHTHTHTSPPSYLLLGVLEVIQRVHGPPKPDLHNSLGIQTPVLHAPTEWCPMSYLGSKHRVVCVRMCIHMHQAYWPVLVLDGGQSQGYGQDHFFLIVSVEFCISFIHTCVIKISVLILNKEELCVLLVFLLCFT